MLAVSAVIRVLFNSDAGSDTKYPGPHIKFVDEGWFDVAIFTLLIFVMVFTCSFLSANMTHKLANSPSQLILKGLKFLEPLLIFTILFGTLPHLLGTKDMTPYVISDIGTAMAFIFKSVLFGLMITVTLIFSRGWSAGLGLFKNKIDINYTNSNNIYTSRFAGKKFVERIKIAWKEFRGWLNLPYLLAALGIFMLMVAALAYAHPITNGPEPDFLLNFSINLYYFATAIGFVLLYWNIPYTEVILQKLTSVACEAKNSVGQILGALCSPNNFFRRIRQNRQAKWVTRHMARLPRIIFAVSVYCLAMFGALEIDFKNRLFVNDVRFINILGPYSAFMIVLAGMNSHYSVTLWVFGQATKQHIFGLSIAATFLFAVFTLFIWRTARQRRAVAGHQNVGSYHYQEDLAELLKAATLVGLIWHFVLKAQLA